MASRPANHRLRALLFKARWTQDALAHAVNAVGAGMNLHPAVARSTHPGPTVAAARRVLCWSAALDHSHGSGHARTPLIAYLAHDLGPELPTARANPSNVAVDLACLAAFRCFDELAHGLAQRYYLAALDLAIRARDPIRYATVLRGLSHQAHQLGHHEHALVLVTRAFLHIRQHSVTAPSASLVA